MCGVECWENQKVKMPIVEAGNDEIVGKIHDALQAALFSRFFWTRSLNGEFVVHVHALFMYIKIHSRIRPKRAVIASCFRSSFWNHLFFSPVCSKQKAGLSARNVRPLTVTTSTATCSKTFLSLLPYPILSHLADDQRILLQQLAQYQLTFQPTQPNPTQNQLKSSQVNHVLPNYCQLVLP